MAAPPSSANLIRRSQRVELASLSYKLNAELDNDWIPLESAYKVEGAKAKKFEVTNNVCDVLFDGGITICQQAEDYHPRLPPAGTPLEQDLVRWQVCFKAGTYGNVVLQEYQSQNEAFWIISIQFTCYARPETGDDTRYMNPEQPAAGANVIASKLPIAQWADKFAELGVGQIKLQFRRSEKSKGLTQWMWPAVLDFLSGISEWSPYQSIKLQKAAFALHLDALATQPRHRQQLNKNGDTYELRSVEPPNLPVTATSSAPSSSSQQLPIIGSKRPTGASDLSDTATSQDDSKRPKLDRPISPHVQSQAGPYEGDRAMRIAHLEGVTAQRSSEIERREQELKRLRTENASDLAEIEELKEALGKMET